MRLSSSFFSHLNTSKGVWICSLSSDAESFTKGHVALCRSLPRRTPPSTWNSAESLLSKRNLNAMLRDTLTINEITVINIAKPAMLESSLKYRCSRNTSMAANNAVNTKTESSTTTNLAYLLLRVIYELLDCRLKQPRPSIDEPRRSTDFDAAGVICAACCASQYFARIGAAACSPPNFQFSPRRATFARELPVEKEPATGAAGGTRP
jgi:hypothetical protein